MILGLTGSFGGGKSTVLSYFQTHNWHTFDADAACHKLYESGNPALTDKVKELFGQDAVDENSKINRQKIADGAFKAPEKLKELTSVLYPLLNEELNRQIADCRRNGIDGVFELPLLYEANYQKCFDAVLTIWCAPDLRCKRLRKRNFSRKDMLERDARQLAPELKLECADFAVINNGSREMLFRQLDELVAKFNNETKNK